MKRALVLIVLLLSSPAWSATYYVDQTGGLDANTGLATDNAWKTIAKVNGETFSAGDSILFKKGETWREQLTVPSSGSAGNPITFSSYGMGATPKITGADLVTPGTSWGVFVGEFGWTTVGGLTSDFGAAQFSCSGKGTPAVSGTVTAISIDSSNADSTADIKVGMYLDNGTAPGTKHGTEQEVQNNATYSREWHDFPYSASVTAGTYYYSCFALSAAGDWLLGYTTSGGTNKFTDTWTYGDVWESPFVVDTSSSSNIAIKAKYTAPNIWQTSIAANPIFVLFDGVLGRRENSLANLNSARDYYWSGGVLYIYSTSDPDTAYTSPGVEVSVRNRNIYITGKDYITIDGIHVMASNSINVNTDGVPYDIRDSTNITVNDFDVKYGYYTGLYAYAATKTVSNITISNGSVSISGNGIGLYGSASYGLDTVTLDNVSVHDISNWGANFPNDTRVFGDIDREGIGINGYGKTTGVTLSDISIYDIGNSTDTNNYGLFLYQTDNTTVERFDIYNCSRAGIAIEDGGGAYGKNITLRYGKVHANGATSIGPTGFSGGISIRTANAGGLDNLSIYNVVIDNNYGNATDNAWKRGGLVLYKYSSAGANDAPILIKNNILSNNDTYELQVHDAGTGGFSGLASDYNLFYRSSDNSIMFGDTAYDTTHVIGGSAGFYSNDQGQDTNSLFANPLFVSSSSSDFHLQATSPAINAGVDVGLTTDYAGRTVPFGVAPDIGAYEAGPWSGYGGGMYRGRMGIHWMW